MIEKDEAVLLAPAPDAAALAGEIVQMELLGNAGAKVTVHDVGVPVPVVKTPLLLVPMIDGEVPHVPTVGVPKLWTALRRFQVNGCWLICVPERKI